MILNKPKFWESKINIFSILLFPLSLIFLLIIFLRKKIIRVKYFNIPIICVGNVYIGGTGKTPASIFLAKELTKCGYNPVILRRYYKDHEDEYELIKKHFKNLILCKKRTVGIKIAEKKRFDSVILDDGFQDYRIKKNLNIICFHQNQLIGNGLVFPSGPLRDKLNSLKDADVVLINGNKDKLFEKKIYSVNKNLEIFYSCYKPQNIKKFRGKKLLALAGIGNPENFFNLIKKHNLQVKEKKVFPDHYRFSENEITKIINNASKKKYKIIMTEKDYFKIKKFKIKNLDFLKVKLEINKKNKLLEKLKNLYDKNS